MSLKPLDIEVLAALIERLNQTGAMSAEEAERKGKQFRSQAIARMFEAGGTYGEASEAPSILNQPYEAFRSEQKLIANKLGCQVEILSEFLDRWFDFGDFVPPGWPWRVTVILRKAKRFDLERRFLSAFTRHIDYGQHGGTGQKITDRAAKLNLVIDVEPRDHVRLIGPWG